MPLSGRDSKNHLGIHRRTRRIRHNQSHGFTRFTRGSWKNLFPSAIDLISSKFRLFCLWFISLQRRMKVIKVKINLSRSVARITITHRALNLLATLRTITHTLQKFACILKKRARLPVPERRVVAQQLITVDGNTSLYQPITFPLRH